MLLWPIGVPAFIFFEMHKSRDLILAEDEDTLQKFDFIMGDYKPSRKNILYNLLLVMLCNIVYCRLISHCALQISTGKSWSLAASFSCRASSAWQAEEPSCNAFWRL